MIQYRILPTERLFVVRYSRKSPPSEWKSVMSVAVETHPEVVTYDSLVDMRTVETFLNAEEMKVHARDVKELGFQDHRRRTAVIVEKTAHYGTSRMFEIITETERIVERLTTRSVTEAAAWLGRPEAFVAAELEAVAREPARSDEQTGS